MKVVINKCYGGFNLSDEAVEECVRRGMRLTGWRADGHYEDRTADFADWDTYKERNVFGVRYTCCDDSRKEFRSNPTLVAVVEELGVKANGPCAELEVVEIPYESTRGWHISEYDGKEQVREDHDSWG